MVVVRATDPEGIPGASSADDTNSDEITVTITITDVNEAPAVTGDATATFDEDTGDETAALHTYVAVDPEADAPITWSVAGADGAKFTAMVVRSCSRLSPTLRCRPTPTGTTCTR